MRWRLSNPQLCHPRVLKQQQHHHQEYFMSKKSCPFLYSNSLYKKEKTFGHFVFLLKGCIMPFRVISNKGLYTIKNTLVVKPLKKRKKSTKNKLLDKMG